MSSPVNLGEELSSACWKCELNQEKTIVGGEKFGCEDGESKQEERQPAMVLL